MIEMSKLTCVPVTTRVAHRELLPGYALSIRSGAPVAGTPERPLSDLGLRTYVAYWVNVIIRFLREKFDQLDHSSIHGATESIPTTTSPLNSEVSVVNRGNADGASSPLADPEALLRSSSSMKKANKETTSASNGVSKSVTVSINDVAKACGFRSEDVATAIERCGLAQWRRRILMSQNGEQTKELQAIQVQITQEQVEAVAVSWKVKPAFLQDQYLLIGSSM